MSEFRIGDQVRWPVFKEIRGFTAPINQYMRDAYYSRDRYLKSIVFIRNTKKLIAMNPETGKPELWQITSYEVNEEIGLVLYLGNVPQGLCTPAFNTTPQYRDMQGYSEWIARWLGNRRGL